LADNTRQLYIGGQWVGATSGRTFDVVNPATREPIASVADGGPDEARAAVDAAAVAFTTWSKLSGIERGRVLGKTYQLMMARCDDIARLVTQETASPLRKRVKR